MNDKKIIPKLKGVPETMLISLRGRYLETKTKDGIINDPKSVEILDKIEHNFSSAKDIATNIQKGTSIRTQIIDELTQNFLEKHKDALVVNLGCGLDTRFQRLDNNSVLWFDLDVPEAIELRKHFFEETDRFKFISKSVLDFSWIDDVPKNKPTLFIAEGLLMYFDEDEVKSIFKKISQEFPDSEMILEAMSPFIVKIKKHPALKDLNVSFKWGVKSGKELEEWGLGINFIKEDYFFDRFRSKIPFSYRIITLIPAFKKMMKIIHIKFEKKD